MTKTRKLLIVVLSVICALCLGLFTLTACGGKKEVKSISVTKDADTLAYVTGADFNSAGMEVTAKYVDDKEEVVDGWTFEPAKLTATKGETAQRATIKITYVDGTGKSVSCNYNKVTVSNKVTAATVKTQPSRTQYFIGQPFDVSGMVLSATFEDGETTDVDLSEVENLKISPEGELAKETKEVTVTYGGFDVKVPVTMLNALYVEAENGYKNGALIEQSTGDSGSIRTDATTAKAKTGAQAIFEAQLKADFALSNLEKADDYNAADMALPSETTKVNVGGKAVTKQYDAIVAWLNDEANKTAIDTYVASDDYKKAVSDYLASAQFKTDYEKFVAHNGGSGENYLGQINQGDVISFVFNSSATAKGSIAFRISSSYLYRDNNGGWLSSIMGDVQFNKLCEFYVNGVKYDMDDDAVLYGGMMADGSSDNVLWCNWKEVPFDGVNFVEGRNVIEIRFLHHGITAANNYNFAANLDTLLVAPEKNASGAESCELNTYDNSKAKVEYTLKSVSLASDGKLNVQGTLTGSQGYVGDILNMKAGTAIAGVTTQGDNFTATVDVSKFAVGEYELSVAGTSLAQTATTTVATDLVKIGFNDYQLVIDETSKVVKLSVTSKYSVKLNSATVDTPVVTLEERSGKAYMVISGGVYNAEIEEFTADEAKPFIEAAIKEVFLLRVQNNPIGGVYSGWDTLITDGKEEVNLLADNKFEIVVDLSVLKTGGVYGVHFNHADAEGKFPTTDGANDFNSTQHPNFTKLDLISVTVGGVKYEAFYKDDNTVHTNFDWNCVAIYVTAA